MMIVARLKYATWEVVKMHVGLRNVAKMQTVGLSIIWLNVPVLLHWLETHLLHAFHVGK